MKFSLQTWLKISLFNLVLVALLGVVLRYKISFSLPFINQKYLLEAHSHFAFDGWVTQALMSLLANNLSRKSNKPISQKYHWLLLGNLVASLGMLIFFSIQGYSICSIIFSTASIIVSYLFGIFYWRDLNSLPEKDVSCRCFKAAVLFNALSSAGPFVLAYMMATKNYDQNLYLAAIYFFLHFQYNGWFFFSCMGLMFDHLIKYGIPEGKLKIGFNLFLSACVPAYFLSAPWLQIPLWVYLLVVAAVFLQLASWFILCRSIKNVMLEIKSEISWFSQLLFSCSAVALSIKLLLQAATVIPSLSKLAFGFRPIVIAYLHLVLLGVITIFILSYMIAFKLISVNKTTIAGVAIFIAGIILNEIFLMIQGAADLDYYAIPWINEVLFGVAVVLLTGVVMINWGQFMRSHYPVER